MGIDESGSEGRRLFKVDPYRPVRFEFVARIGKRKRKAGGGNAIDGVEPGYTVRG